MTKRPEPIELDILCASTMNRCKGERWYWRARKKGTRQDIWTGWATRSEAFQELAKLLTKGIPETSSPSAPRVVRTVADLLNGWVAHQEKREQAGEIAPKSLVNYRQAARYWLEDLGELLTGRVTRAMIEDQATKWQAAGVAPRTAKMAVDGIASAWKWGSERGHCPPLSLSRLNSLRIRDDEHVNNAHSPSRADARAAIALLRPGRPTTYAARLLAATGARVGEVGAARCADWDRQRAVLKLQGADLERKRRGKVKARYWPVLTELAALLDELTAGRGPDERLIPGLPRDVAKGVAVPLEKACKRAGVEVFTAHGLRRMVAMELLEHNDPKTVSLLTGHSVLVLLRDYVRPPPDRLREAVARSMNFSGKVIHLRRGALGNFRGTSSGHNPPESASEAEVPLSLNKYGLLDKS